MFKSIHLPKLFADGKVPQNWFCEIILIPFLITRTCWLLIAFYATGNYLPNPTYARYAERGFFLTHLFPIDIFTRWDSGNYFSIITQGYTPSSNLYTEFSNIAFFPLYPYLVKSFGWFGFYIPDGIYVISGVILSNLSFLLAMALLYRIIILEFNLSEQTARRAIRLLFVFPTSFIFSSFYTESLFLFLLLLGFIFAWNNRWKLAALITFLLLVTRAQGLIAWVAIILFYLERRDWNIKKIKSEIIWLLLAPLGLISHLYYLYKLTGVPLAPFVAMTAWGRGSSGFISNLIENLSSPYLDVFKIDLFFSIIFISLSIYILWKWPMKSIGFLALGLCIMPIASGLLVSVSRYLLLVFPVYILLGEKIKNNGTFDFVQAVLFSLQIIYFTGWVNYYWIV